MSNEEEGRTLSLFTANKRGPSPFKAKTDVMET